MNCDFYSGSYMQLTELQPIHSYQHCSMMAHSTASSSYEMTADGATGVGDAGLGMPVPALQPASTLTHALHHDQRKRSASHFGDVFDGMSTCDSSVAASSTASMAAPSSRKRKTSSFGTASAYDDDDDARSARTMPDKRNNHSEIEKRRRDKMNTYISELSAIVPMCGAMSRKLDKLTVLRMAVQHLRRIRGRAAGPLETRPRPSLLSDREINGLVVGAASGTFLLVLSCDRGRLLYVSASVTAALQYQQGELLGQSLFDILHPKDVAKVKEQLSSSELNPRERFIDAKTMLPVKADVGVGASGPRLGSGARRSFCCRIKCKSVNVVQAIHGPHPEYASHSVKEELEPISKIRKKHHEKKYCAVQCTGYLKSWSAGEVCESAAGLATEGAFEDEDTNVMCLVAVGRILPTPPPPQEPLPYRRVQFVSRHAIDGKYMFVDQRVTLALGYLPQELLGTSLYEMVCPRSLASVARAHTHALAKRHAITTPTYTARRKDGSQALLTTRFKPFRNPWTKDVECIVALNTLVSSHVTYDPLTLGESDRVWLDDTQLFDMSESSLETEEPADLDGGEELSDGDAEVQRLIDSQVESHKIGSAIAAEAVRRSPAAFSPDLPPDVMQDAVFNQVLVENMLGAEMPYEVRNNVPLSDARSPSPPPEMCAAAVEVELEVEGNSPDCATSPLTLDGNGEAAMAVIMSLLEADAGLGGPVNFSGLPWPLP